MGREPSVFVEDVGADFLAVLDGLRRKRGLLPRATSLRDSDGESAVNNATLAKPKPNGYLGDSV
jgi:hypothetical protein